MSYGLSLFIIGLLGFIQNRKHVLLSLLSIEVMILGSTVCVLVGSYVYGDVTTLSLAIYYISIAACEAALGLGIVVIYNRTNGTISL